jgi:nucleoid DNA-binding protein
MIKKEVMEIIKEEMGLESIKATEEFVAKLDKVFGKIAESLEERKSGATDKASLGSLTLEKAYRKPRPTRNPKTGENLGMSEEKFVVQGKIK